MIYNKKIFYILINLVLSNLIVFFVNANVVVSIKPIGFITSAIIDNILPVDVIVPDGSSGHDYVLRPSDEKKIKNTDFLIWSGSEIEAFMSKSVLHVPINKILVVTEIPAVKKLLIKIKEDNCIHQLKKQCIQDPKLPLNSKKYNMHFWTSPDIAKIIAIEIYKKLSEIMPQYKEKLNQNLKQFEISLNNIDKQIMMQLAPIKNKKYFVFHDAYIYFEKHYGLSSLGHFTINPEIQPGVKSLYNIRKQIKEKQVTCVFAEPQFKPAIIDTVTRGIKINKGVLDPLGCNIKLSKDSYLKFLLQLSSQYNTCLKDKI
ncbi:zinc ABC transporter substrate-binding protein [Candidatus Pantoea edessiphila]|uniref:High-affinity zinc uptake system protein ZnuA n=1 Tax=Candidatus Pantoea edessiphila TaxID=2044610 RepID=A0A2P5SYQ8_9GAMM|nr:zinc ABC transporter substrate-binding protein ZnuA [Candidatus Pantoea edessiphila]MBK4775438.1 zinc ABC transporter substrate-binding protein ZnuA [Pantoea sp. Edef]PPI87433.1 zinc ABC transporter substrate-binding protein [Candidatus Pantoea edessiphila]